MPDAKKPAAIVDKMPTPEAFCLTVPLYDGFRYDYEKNGGFYSIEQFKGTCACKQSE